MQIVPLFRLSVPLLIVLLAASLSPAIATDVIRNGSFDAGLDEWILVSDELAYWTPLVEEGIGRRANKFVQLSPNGYLYGPTDLYQNLNVTEVAGKEVSLSFVLSHVMFHDCLPVDVYLDYLDTANQLQSVKVFTYAEWTWLWTACTSTYSLPSDVRMLVKVHFRQDLYSEVRLDKISLTAEGISVGGVPEIQSISPESGPYGALVTIAGANFGDNAQSVGKVTLDGSTSGVQVESWTDTEIGVRFNDPARTGRVVVTADDVESNNDRTFKVTSPYFTVAIANPGVRVIRGQDADFVIRTDFSNRLQTDGITFRSPDAPEGIATFEPLPLKHPGGVRMRVKTAGLPAGEYTWHVESVEPNFQTRTAECTLQVVTVQDIELTLHGDETYLESPTALNVTKQGIWNVSADPVDSDGWRSSYYGVVTVTSGDPSILLVRGNRDGGYCLCAIESGSTTLTLTTPDGYSETIPVNIDLAEGPRITSMTVTPSTVTNGGNQLITVMAEGTDDMRIDPWGLSAEFPTLEPYDEGRGIVGTAKIEEGTEPSDTAYGFAADVHSLSRDPRMITPITVVNDPSRGEIRGSIYHLSNGGATSANLELYDSNTGVQVKECQVDRRGYSHDYRIGYVPPGEYRLRLDMGTHRPGQWWPNAYRFEDAEEVTIAPGCVADGVILFAPVGDSGSPGPPVVVDTVPKHRSIGVTTTPRLKAFFDRQLHPAGLAADALTLIDSRGNRIEGDVSECDTFAACFEPSSPLTPGETYTATLTGIKAWNGEPMADDYTWSFEVGADVDSVGDLRDVADGISFSVEATVVHCLRDGFAYIEDEDRSSGIRVEGWLWDLHKYDSPIIIGVVQTKPDGERYIDIQAIRPTVWPGWINPLGASMKSLKTRMMDGLYVKTWGMVFAPVTGDSFVLTDGSSSSGVVVLTSDPHGFSEGQFVAVTGAAGWDGARIIHAETVTLQE